MATSVTQSLFGMSPQAIQAQRAADLNAQALQYAQLNPTQAARAGAFRAGSLFGDAAAGAMGYEDPEIAQAKQIQGMLGGADMNDPDSLMQIAQRIQSVNPAAAQELAQRAMTMRKTQAEIRVKEAEPINKLIQQGKYTPESVDAYEQTGRISDLKLTESETKFSVDAEEVARELHGKSFKDLTPEEANEVNILRNQRRVQEKQAGAARTNVKVGGGRVGTIPPGFELVEGPDGALSMVPIAGGPAAIEAQKAADAAAKGSEVVMTAAQTVFEDATRALNVLDKYGKAAAGIGGLTASIPATPAKELDGHIFSMKGNIGIDQLLKIKASGAGLGQIPQAQLEMLGAMLGNLDVKQNPRVLRENINRIQEIYSDIVEKEGGNPIELARQRGFLPAEEGPKRNLTAQDKQAKAWAEANPNDPRAAAIKLRLGVD
jgi:hypothetical protein